MSMKTDMSKICPSINDVSTHEGSYSTEDLRSISVCFNMHNYVFIG